MATFRIDRLNEIAQSLSAIEDWLRDHCEARHSESMADEVHSAWQVIEELIDAFTDARDKQ